KHPQAPAAGRIEGDDGRRRLRPLRLPQFVGWDRCDPHRLQGLAAAPTRHNRHFAPPPGRRYTRLLTRNRGLAMRSSILTFCVAAAVVMGGCSRDGAPTGDTAATPDAEATAPPAEYDSLSYAQPDQVRIKDLALALAVDFDAKQISGSATYQLDWTNPEANQLVLDTRDLTIEKVVGERGDDKWI